MLPTMAGAANRCVIPECKFDIEHLTELLCDDRARNPSKYSVVIVSEGAMFEGGEMVFSDRATDAFGHLKLGGIGDLVSAELKARSAKYNKATRFSYDNMPIEVVTSTKKTVNVEKYYNKERLRPLYTDFEMQPLFIMASD